MPQRSVASNYTFEQQRTEINLLAADFWTQKANVDNASSTYLKHNGSNDFTGGTLNVPSAFTISPDSGNGTLTISGNLNVTGTTTTVNTTNLDVTDKNITIAKGNNADSSADGAGITIDSATDITWNFVDANDAWVSSIGVEATNFLKGPYGHFTGSGSYTPTSGQGVEINVPDANTGQIISYDRDNNAYKDLRIKGSSVGVYTGTTNTLAGTFNSTGLTMESGKTIELDDTIVHSGDTDTKIRFPGANEVSFETGGSERLKVSNFGLFVQTGLQLGFLASSGPSPSIKSGGPNDQNLLLTTGTNNPTRMVIDNDGDVGIGEDNPGSNNEKLTVREDIEASSGKAIISIFNLYQGTSGQSNASTGALEFTFKNHNASHNWWGGRIACFNTDNYNQHTYLRFDTANAGNASGKMWLRNDGKLGLGTDSPDEMLHLSTTGTCKLRLEDKRTSISDGSQYGVIQFEQRDSNTPGVAAEMAAVMIDTTNGATALQFRTGTPSTIDERLRITHDGRVGVGTNNPHTSYRFDIRHTSDSILHLGQNDNTLSGMGNDSWNALSFQGTNCELGLYKDGSGNFSYIMGTYQGSTDIPLIFRTGNRVERLRIAPDGQLIHKTNKSSGYIAEFHQEHADNPGTLLIDGPTDNNIRPSALHLAQAGTVKWVLGQVYASTSSQAFHLCSGTGEANSKFVVTTAGNIGINEVSPDNKLHVTTTNSTAYSTNTSNTQNTGNALLKLQNLDGSDGSGVNNYVGIQFSVASGATSSAQLNYVRTADNSGRFAFKARNGGGNDYPNLMDITSSGQVLIGASSSTSNAKLAVNGAIGSPEAFFELNRTDDPANGQNVGVIEFNQGNAASRNAARIITRRDGGVWGAASLPTRFEFHTCNSGSNTAAERMRITSDGAVQMEYLNPADGSTAARAARSAVEIKKYYPNSPTGNYWIIAPNGQGAKQIRCDMETDGGGWMLWYAHNSYGSNNMNEQCGGNSTTPSSHIAASNMGSYAKYTCWMEASRIDNGDRQSIDSFVQLDQNGQIRYKADYGEEFFPEEVGNPFDPQDSACFNSGDSEWWGGNDMYSPVCGASGGWQAYSGGGWSRVWIREPESDISPGTVRTCHGIPRVYGRDTDGVPSWHLHESAIIMPYWSEMTYLNGAVANGNSQWTSNNGRAIGNTTISNNGPCVQGRLKGYLTGEFEIKFNLGYEWGWSVLALGNSRSHEARSRDPITWGNVYNHATDIKGAYTMHNNSSNNHWMPAYRSGDGIWNEVQHSPGAPQNVDQFMWRESDGTIRIRRSDGTHGTYTYPIKWAGPFMVTSAHQSPCYINIQEITDGGSWSKWYK